jgi:integrase
VILTVLTGLRRGELAALRWRNNPDTGKLLVDEAVYFGNADEPEPAGKGGKVLAFRRKVG